MFDTGNAPGGATNVQWIRAFCDQEESIISLNSRLVELELGFGVARAMKAELKSSLEHETRKLQRHRKAFEDGLRLGNELISRNESLRVSQNAREEAVMTAQRRCEQYETRIREKVRLVEAEVESQYQRVAESRTKLDLVAEAIGEANAMKLKQTLDEAEKTLPRRTSL